MEFNWSCGVLQFYCVPIGLAPRHLDKLTEHVEGFKSSWAQFLIGAN